jgi:hypothetical protein
MSFRKRLVGLPMGAFRPDPTLARTTKGSGRGNNAKTQDAKIRELVARERAKQAKLDELATWSTDSESLDWDFIEEQR